MARLRLSVVVPAPQEQVYEYITAFGPQGPTDESAFRDKHGEPLEREGNTIVTRDGDEEEAITWRCTFNPPVRRHMEAVDSTWADRTDIFQEARSGTHWTVLFVTGRSGPVGFVQWLFFRLVTKSRIRRAIMEPVVHHFCEGLPPAA